METRRARNYQVIFLIMLVRVLVHCHSLYSRDSLMSLQEIIAGCRQHSIQVIALTDHDTIEGAVELKKIAFAGLRVILGEEITTAQGDMIGLFLQERIRPTLSVEKTISIIHEQGGIAILPHAFDRLRSKAMGAKVTALLTTSIDAIETFNARCVFSGDNIRAQEFALQKNIQGVSGCDAHTYNELGNAIGTMNDFINPGEFLESLKEARWEQHLAGIGVHVKTAMVKRMKKIQS